MKTYRGECHCGRVRFSFAAAIDHARECDCSICTKRGGLMFRVPKDALVLETPWQDLTLYQWGSRTARDYFCSCCGVLPFRRPSDPTPRELEQGVEPFDGWAINLRCVRGLNLDGLPRRKICGSEIELPAGDSAHP